MHYLHITAIEKDTRTDFNTIIFVLGLIRLFNSCVSSFQPLFSFAFQRLTSAPTDRGREYSCWYVGYWTIAWSPGPSKAKTTRKFASDAPGVVRIFSEIDDQKSCSGYICEIFARNSSDPLMEEP